ncbi:hypothetical protein TWF481_011705 [Arthrobotrys musiformis]|uniref:Uncharacterized protein n=1 Tax=Arthrobotrys musiformis TaxID=47236 RepID=A0AAV9W538_9PEZI
MGATLSILSTQNPDKCIQVMEDALTNLADLAISARFREVYPQINRLSINGNRSPSEEENLTVEQLKRQVADSVRLWKVFEEGVGYLFRIEEEAEVRAWVGEVVKALKEEVEEIEREGVVKSQEEEGKGKERESSVD